MNVLWLSDLHLNWLSRTDAEQFVRSIDTSDADIAVVCGDTCMPASEEEQELGHNQSGLLGIDTDIPVFYVLGNHDFYGSSSSDVRVQLLNEIHLSAAENPRLAQCYLAACGNPIWLSEDTCIFGHDGWYDGRAGNYEHSYVMLNDFSQIGDFTRLLGGKHTRLNRMQVLADFGTEHIESMLHRAVLQGYKKFICVTHVPPFVESSRYGDRPTGDDFLPFFCNFLLGERLRKFMLQHPEHELTVFCGHTHTAVDIQILDNLRVLVAGAEYGHPEVQGVVEV